MAASPAFEHFENKLSAEYILGHWTNKAFVPHSWEAALTVASNRKPWLYPAKRELSSPRQGNSCWVWSWLFVLLSFWHNIFFFFLKSRFHVWEGEGKTMYLCYFSINIFLCWSTFFKGDTCGKNFLSSYHHYFWRGGGRKGLFYTLQVLHSFFQSVGFKEKEVPFKGPPSWRYSVFLDSGRLWILIDPSVMGCRWLWKEIQGWGKEICLLIRAHQAPGNFHTHLHPYSTAV